MKNNNSLRAAIGALSLAILACNLPSQNGASAVLTAAADTAEAQMTLDAKVNQSATFTAAAAFTPTPPAGPTAIPSPTATSTPEGTYFIVDVGANCRSGPSQSFDVMATVPVGAYLLLVGRNIDDSWWYVQLSSTLDCWISTITGHTTGNIGGLPVIAAPPTPTPTLPPAAVDTTPPMISDVNPLEAVVYYYNNGCGTNQLDIGARIHDDASGVATAYVQYRYVGGGITSVWKTAPINDQAMGGQYGFLIYTTNDLSGNDGVIQYQVFARDNAGNTSNTAVGSVPIKYCP